MTSRRQFPRHLAKQPGLFDKSASIPRILHGKLCSWVDRNYDSMEGGTAKNNGAVEKDKLECESLSYDRPIRFKGACSW